MDNTENKTMSRRNKIILAILISLAVVMIVVWNFVLPMIAATVGGSFGYGFPSGSGGRAIRSVEIDVDPQVVYRIDNHRFFTLENYVSCHSGGLVYYNDTNKKIKIFAGLEGDDKNPQDEFSISRQNDVLSFNGKFIYAAGDDLISYPHRFVNYKYGNSEHYIVSESLREGAKSHKSENILPSDTVIVTNDAVYIQDRIHKELLKRIISIGSKDKVGKWIDNPDFKIEAQSIDERFHCDDNIKPRSIRYLKASSGVMK
ncbi:T6SS immunity protein Tli3 family protein [Pantoea trifolii]|uniref:T6SS immunity protein Tli3 family protein n=1 Tax=Candidatus Pantoea symbiotica TaxID=1884370 RepID=UPI0024134643|nr:hypothetical protein [Pantoea rodasii]